MYPIMERVARIMAILGGLVLTALIIMTCVSVLGRGLNTLGHSAFLTGLAPGLAGWLVQAGVGPVQGDFELVEAGIAFCVFAFLPLCQLHRGHATVDIFTNALPRPVNAFIIAFWEILLTLAILLISWRLFVGMLDKHNYAETTFILQFPVWWAYAASFMAALVASIVALYCAFAHIQALRQGKSLEPSGQGAIH
ncbi:MAG: TRAP transporter small permease subunit [Thiothrix sp.]|nr:TRAP transporter small permease subunit [Thiothrix sp.]HPQ96683.1 TRAP transporter small permease subunit [Thiolinea sp.]